MPEQNSAFLSCHLRGETCSAICLLSSNIFLLHRHVFPCPEPASLFISLNFELLLVIKQMKSSWFLCIYPFSLFVCVCVCVCGGWYMWCVHVCEQANRPVYIEARGGCQVFCFTILSCSFDSGPLIECQLGWHPVNLSNLLSIPTTVWE